VLGTIGRFDRRFRWLIVATNGSCVRIVIAPILVLTARRAKRRIAKWFPVR
jgi:hypothetical protein